MPALLKEARAPFDMQLADVKESAWMALETVRANKLRSTLTILGVSVGVVTVVFMVSIIQGLNKAFASQAGHAVSNGSRPRSGFRST